MLEDFLSPIAARRLRLRSSARDVDLDAYCARLVDIGYRPSTIRGKLWIVSGLLRWMTDECVAATDLDERKLEEHVEARRQGCHRYRGFITTLLQLLGHLRVAGIASAPASQAAAGPPPPMDLLARYQEYLRRERAVAECTVTGYSAHVRAFITEHLEDEARPTGLLGVDDAREFLLGRARQMAPKRAQYMATALRSFLRFLFIRGETCTDLALAVPTVRRWRLATIPRALPPEDVERLLQACEHESPTGLRNHAILLLLARLGLRASEIVTLELGDVHWRQGEIVVRGKGSSCDRLPLPRDVGEALAFYLRGGRPRSSSRRVFLRGRPPHRGLGHASTVSSIVRRALPRADLTPPTRGAHLLRHSLASSMLRHGASLAEIGQVLRHRSPGTTEIYAKLDFDALRDVALPWPARGGAR